MRWVLENLTEREAEAMVEEFRTRRRCTCPRCGNKKTRPAYAAWFCECGAAAVRANGSWLGEPYKRAS